METNDPQNTLNTKKTKTCRSCKEEINATAKRCPRCQSFQARWIWLWAFLPFILIVPSMYYSFSVMYKMNSKTEVKFPEIKEKLTVTDVHLKRENPVVEEGTVTHYYFQQVWVYGTLKNDTDYRWEDFDFLVEFYDDDGKRVDLVNKSDFVTVQPHSTLEIRLSCDMTVDPKQVDKTKVIVTDARQPYR